MQVDPKTAAKVDAFFRRDDISRAAPGMKDYKKVAGELIQIRHLYYNITEAHNMFKEENPEDCISRTKFSRKRPSFALPLDEMPENVCVCPVHENVFALMASIKSSTAHAIPISGRELIDACCCSRDNPKCMNMTVERCGECKDLSIFYRDIGVDGSKEVKWMQWVTRDKRLVKVQCVDTCQKAIDELSSLWLPFLSHCFVKDAQSACFESSKIGLGEDTAIVQVDFAENYATFFQDVAQSAHFAYNRVTVFTCCVWLRSGVKSVCIVSHDKYSVHCFLQTILRTIKEYSEKIKCVKFFSDGSAAQFKNRFLFSNLTWFLTEFELEALSWHFFASHHGKGAVDGLGGSVKRAVRRKVLSDVTPIVQNGTDFVQAVGDGHKIELQLVQPESILGQKEFLDQRWLGIKTMPGTQQVHYLTVTDGSSDVWHGRYVGGPLVRHSFSRLVDSGESILPGVVAPPESET